MRDLNSYQPGGSSSRSARSWRTGTAVGGVSSEISVLRLDFGYFVRPAEETGSTAPRVEPVLGYLVQHPKGTVLLDSGMGLHPDIDDHYRPRRIALPDALHAAGLAVEDLTVVANCHLHFDHCGGNPVAHGPADRGAGG